MPKSQNYRVGLFVIVATVALVTIVALVAGLRFRTPRDRYTVRFAESVSGLEPGAAVKYRGVRVGTVEGLLIPEDDMTTVEIRIGVGVGTPIKTDTEAALSSVGITGLRFVDLIGGSADAPRLEKGERIPSQESLMATLSGRAVTAAEKADVLLDNLLTVTNEEDYARAREGVGELQVSFLESSARLNDLLLILSSAAVRLDSVLSFTNGMLERNDERISRSLTELEGALSEMHTTLTAVNDGNMIHNINETAQSARDVMTDVRFLVSGNRRSLAESMVNLRETSANLKQFSRIVRDRPSLLIRSSNPEPRQVPDTD